MIGTYTKDKNESEEVELSPLFVQLTLWTKHYLHAKGQLDTLPAKQQPPAKPTVFTSQGDIDRYETDVEKWANGEKYRTEQHGYWLNKLDTAAGQIKALIHYKNLWYQVEVDGKLYGVGMYLETWGGNSYQINVEPWTEPMPPCSDHDYYP